MFIYRCCPCRCRTALRFLKLGDEGYEVHLAWSEYERSLDAMMANPCRVAQLFIGGNKVGGEGEG